MAVTEILDIFDEHWERIGTASREDVHRLGLWHQVFHCWIVSGSAEQGWELLFQLRHPDKETFPNCLDTSCAGHLLAGETPEDGLRELEEELGLSARYEDLIYCGLHREEYRVADDYMDREFTHVHLQRCELPPEEYRVQQSEVSGLFRVKAEDFRKLLQGEQDAIPAEGVVYDEKQHPVRERRSVALSDFTDNTETYYDLLFDALKKL
ncbi:hypothetical protein CDO73_03655 [Saccharibacillus sp. O23]|uniref:NUDIX hydrolase n=1 Tax=Saccharibacillus sp. O23 TaxID=2009338 RepID=UPI000B4E0F6D|nr:NUDIX domain-containing protein [Saccharibacillus sp. O23]OWR32707.1 hypothetical protein CDO73_03655 [Saccharibacillus sp. O23]